MAWRVINKTRGTVLAIRAEVASSFGQRFLGLMGRTQFETGQGLHILHCNSIHMFFMRFPIDALFLDAELTVVRLLPALAPWRVSSLYPKARSVLELPAGIAAASGTLEGDCLAFDLTGD